MYLRGSLRKYWPVSTTLCLRLVYRLFSPLQRSYHDKDPSDGLFGERNLALTGGWPQSQGLVVSVVIRWPSKSPYDIRAVTRPGRYCPPQMFNGLTLSVQRGFYNHGWSSLTIVFWSSRRLAYSERSDELYGCFKVGSDFCQHFSTLHSNWWNKERKKETNNTTDREKNKKTTKSAKYIRKTAFSFIYNIQCLYI